MSHFTKQFNDSGNCLMVQEFECDKCALHFLCDRRGGEMKCPDCGGMLEAAGSLVINRGECRHTLKPDGHEHHL